MLFKKSVMLMVIMLFVAAFAYTPEAEAATLKVTNNSASEIHAIYISGSGTDDWEENIIDGYMLPSGNEVDIQVPNYRSFDLRVEDEDGNYEDYHDFPGKTRHIVLQGGGDSEYQ